MFIMANSQNKQVSTAVILIAIGSFLLLNKLHIFYLPWYIFTWQFLLIGIGFILIITQDKWESGVVLMTIGGAFLLPRVIDISFREVLQYWPVLLIVIGVVILVRHLDQPKNTNNQNEYGNRKQ